MLADISAQLSSAQQRSEVDRPKARRLVGRLSNISQVEPLIRPHMHGGYTVSEARWAGAGGQPDMGIMRMRVGSPAHIDWVALLTHSHSILTEDKRGSHGPEGHHTPS